MKYIIIIALFLSSAIAQGQVRPDQFPTKTNPDGNDEIYSQQGGTTPVKIKFADAKKYFAAHIRLSQISYTPSPTGNTTDKTLFVKDPDGDIYYIDGDGNGILIEEQITGVQTLELTDTYKIGISGGNIIELSVGDYYVTEIHNVAASSNSITVATTLPVNSSAVEVYRNGLAQTLGVDYAITGQDIIFLKRDLFNGERVKVSFPKK